jgi:hypothetical protein
MMQHNKGQVLFVDDVDCMDDEERRVEVFKR